MNSKKGAILFLHTEFMGYTFALAKAIVENYQIEVHIVKKDKNLVRKYIPEQLAGINYYNRSEYDNEKKLITLIQEIKPKLIYIANWHDRIYKKVTIRYQKLNFNIPVLTGTDHPWTGSFRQWGGILLAPFILHKHFSHLWVAGLRQYELGRRLGFKTNQIIPFLYTADLNRFNTAYNKYNLLKKKKYPKRILFVGRFAPVKGIDLLIRAFQSIPKEKRLGWKLRLIGNGDFPILESEDIEIIDFLQPDDLIKEIETTGIFCLPSTYEPWGVVIHEFAAGGIPLLVSDTCGAASSFVIDGYNGFTFLNKNEYSLKEKLERMINKPENELFQMGNRSHELSKSITPVLSAASLMSVLS